MKSSFLSLVILGALITTPTLAQTKKVTKATSAKVQKVEPEKSSFDKFYERLSINHFSVFTSPNLKKWDSRHGALSPDYTGGTNQDSYPMSLWNQVNFAYNFGAKLKFNVIPRYTIFLGEAKTQSPGERGTILLEDALVAFSGVIYSSDNKKFNWWTRPGMRLPTSHASRNHNHPDFGRITYQLEWINTFSYDFTKEFQLGLTTFNRLWIFENRFNDSRNRILTIPYVSYAVSDKTKVQAYYEHFLENIRNYKSINGKDQHYTDVWQNFMVGVAHDVTPKLNVMPFVSAFVNDVPFATKSLWLGAWISYQIK